MSMYHDNEMNSQYSQCVRCKTSVQVGTMFASVCSGCRYRDEDNKMRAEHPVYKFYPDADTYMNVLAVKHAKTEPMSWNIKGVGKTKPRGNGLFILVKKQGK